MFLSDDDIKKFKKGVEQRLKIGNDTKEYQAYFVPLENLFFNDMNGRIATYIEENDYEKDSSVKIADLLKNGKIDEYNDQIAQFIKDSANDDGASFKKTKEDIRKNRQKIPGVILRDGRVIDGNRRFTCLRELLKETGDQDYAFFECVILDVPETKQEKKQIKILELNLQFNEDVKRDYNRIDYLVSFYRDTMDTTNENRIDKQTYCAASGKTETDYKKDTRIVEIMLDYLEWREKPRAFSLLKNEKLDGPIEEIAAKTAKWTKDEWDDKKTTIYTYMSFNRTGDRTRDTRKLLVSASNNGYLFNHVKEIVEDEKILSRLPMATAALESAPKTVEESKENNQLLGEFQDTLIRAYKDGAYEESSQKDIQEPLDIIKDVIKRLNKISALQIRQFPSDKKQEFLDSVSEAEGIIKSLKEEINK